MLLTDKRRLRELAGIAETANLLLLRLMWRDREAAHQYPGLCYRQYVKLHGAAPWRSADIFEFVPELQKTRTRATLAHVPGEGIATASDELAYMALITAAIEPKRIFEFGTFRGRTALNFAINSPDSCEVFTLDLPKDVTGSNTDLGVADRQIVDLRDVGYEYQDQPESHKIHQLFGDSTSFDLSDYHGTCDMVFVDGGHTYDICRSDTLNALKMCRSGGIILWHDWANYGEYHDVLRAVLSVLPGRDLVQLESSQLAAYRVP
jgi:predicted O-methyltransferase YrrM